LVRTFKYTIFSKLGLIEFKDFLKEKKLINFFFKYLHYLSFFMPLKTNFQHFMLRKNKCIICHEKIDSKKIKSNDDIGKCVVCVKCQELFSNSELEMMKNIFQQYGGWFNKMKTKSNQIELIAENLKEEIRRGNNYSNLFEINEKALHQALIHGIRPRRFLKYLKTT